MSGGDEREFIDHLQNKERGGKAMKCPLAVLGYVMKVGSAPTHQADCLKEECAWWDKKWGRCGVLSLVVEIDEVSGALQGMVVKMPHAGQFKK